MKKNLRGFSQVNFTELKTVVAFIESYIGEEGKMVVAERMKGDLRGLSQVNLTELEKVVEFVEGYIGKEGVKEKMKRDIQGFSKVKLSDLKKTEKLLGKKGMKIALERYSLQNKKFRIANTEGSCEEAFAVK